MVTLLRVSLLIFCIISQSCTLPLKIKDNFTYCYNPSGLYDSVKIKLNGYYMIADSFRNVIDINGNLTARVPISPIYNRIMFFQDGIVVKGQFGGLNCANCDNETTNHFLEKISRSMQPETKAFYEGYNWGVYMIFQDTIRIQTVNHQSWPNPYWDLFEHWFLINIDGSLSPIYTKNLIDGRESKRNARFPRTYKFIETNLKLSSDTWLKKEEWFWCKNRKRK